MHEITKSGPLLDKKGRLTEAGYAKSLILTYDRKVLKYDAEALKKAHEDIISAAVTP